MSVDLRLGDCRQRMAEMPDNSVDSIVCDPPYELGFMGKSWDASGIAYDQEVWRQALRVLKPGGHLLAFSGSRTYHWMACAIEVVGFEIRDQIMWVYGSGFPKSLDVSKAIDKAAGAEREVLGIDQAWVKRTGMSAGEGTATFTTSTFGSASGPNAGKITAPATDDARRWQGWGTALKPAHEPICVARKPLDGTVAANVLKYGTGAINVDGCRVPADDGYTENAVTQGVNTAQTSYAPAVVRRTFEPSNAGRWPANFIHDGSEEATAGLGEAARFFYCAKASRSDREEGCDDIAPTAPPAAELKVSLKSPRAGAGRLRDTVQNNHPTVKPTELMRYLVRLVTPPGGTVLDPFMGSGSTGKAAALEGFNFIGIEMNEDYLAIARARINATIPPILRGTP